ncbi:MAG: type II toxin-antitoxin system Phd/YefM family antitoxin [Gemmatimonadetes bacterium]|nr:type II toxin-antitoxin system Phd/YefM family antitoxin [Gemmatimonadota bacterium]MYC69917.1 type II toxin-antitoxin system Phd/YefM family antitoxin [Gemmatimonadota bacterium]
MKASITDLRRRMKDILLALDRNESVTILYRGKEKAILSPIRQRTRKPVKDHEAFGMWRDRKDMADVDAYVRNLRKGPLND